MARIQELAGGATGIGGTIALRQFADSPDQPRFMQPSFLYGVGSGLLASGMYFSERFGLADLPLIDPTMFATHAMTSTPTGLFFAAFPKNANQSTAEQISSELRSRLGIDLPTNRDRSESGSSGSGSVDQERLRLNRVGTPSGRSRRR